MSDIVQALKDRIEQLEAVLGVDRSLKGRLREAYKIEPLHAEMLGMFLKRDFVTRDGLYTVLYGDRPDCEWPDEKILDVQLCKLRAVLKRQGHDIVIKTKTGEGWSMDKASKVAIQKRLDGPPDAIAAIPPDDVPPLAPNAAQARQATLAKRDAEYLASRRKTFLHGADYEHAA